MCLQPPAASGRCGSRRRLTSSVPVSARADGKGLAHVCQIVSSTAPADKPEQYGFGWAKSTWTHMEGSGTKIAGHDSEQRDACYKRVPECPPGLASCSVAVKPFVVPSAPCCLGPRGIGWGLPFIALLGAVAAVYVGGGVAQSPRRSISGHPHYPRWKEIHGLCRDGVVFATSSRQKAPERGDYAPLPASDASSPTGGERKASKQKREKTKKGSEKAEKRREKPEAAAAGDAGSEEGRQRAGVQERYEKGNLHESQAAIKVVGLNEMSM